LDPPNPSPYLTHTHTTKTKRYKVQNTVKDPRYIIYNACTKVEVISLDEKCMTIDSEFQNLA